MLEILSGVSHIKKSAPKKKVNKKKLLQTPVTHVENYIFIMTVHTKTKNFFFAKKEHEKTHCKTKKPCE